MIEYARLYCFASPCPGLCSLKPASRAAFSGSFLEENFLRGAIGSLPGSSGGGGIETKSASGDGASTDMGVNPFSACSPPPPAPGGRLPRTSFTVAPHRVQNFAPAFRPAPHFAQNIRWFSLPDSMNRRVAGFSLKPFAHPFQASANRFYLPIHCPIHARSTFSGNLSETEYAAANTLENEMSNGIIHEGFR